MLDDLKEAIKLQSRELAQSTSRRIFLVRAGGAGAAAGLALAGVFGVRSAAADCICGLEACSSATQCPCCSSCYSCGVMCGGCGCSGNPCGGTCSNRYSWTCCDGGFWVICQDCVPCCSACAPNGPCVCIDGPYGECE